MPRESAGRNAAVITYNNLIIAPNIEISLCYTYLFSAAFKMKVAIQFSVNKQTLV